MASTDTLPYVPANPPVTERTGELSRATWDELYRISERLGAFGDQSRTMNGYVKLPGGLIVQWGYGLQEVDGSVNITYPIAFPNAALSAQVSPYTSPGFYGFVTIVDITSSGMTVESRNAAGELGQIYFYWMAIGH